MQDDWPKRKMEPAKIILLAGAPETDSLDWSEASLSVDFEHSVKRFLGQEQADISSLSTLQPTPSLPTATWRKPVINDDARFLNASAQSAEQVANVDGAADDSKYDLAFLEHSLALLDDLDSSQIAPGTVLEDEHGDSTFISMGSSISPTSSSGLEKSFTTSNSGPSAAQQQSPFIAPRNFTVTDLKSLPSAHTLESLHPQTPTVNLFVGIITLYPIRTVQLRRARTSRRNASNGNNSNTTPTMNLLEMLVGDDTRAGFKITFWLPPQQQDRSTHSLGENQQHQQLTRPAEEDDLRAVLSARQPGELVLLRNVALAAFRGVVYGQSLSRRFARNSTGVSVLANEEEDMVLDGVMRGKWERVKKWRDDFLGLPIRAEGSVLRKESRNVKGKGKGREILVEAMPPDTQD